MPDNSAILYAATINGDGSGTRLSQDDASSRAREDALAWVHLDGRHPDTRRWIETELDYLDPLAVDALLAEETRPRLVEVERGALRGGRDGAEGGEVVAAIHHDRRGVEHVLFCRIEGLRVIVWRHVRARWQRWPMRRTPATS